ncbi:MAG: hypothetical protein PHC39_07625, partial [Proteiniphilum sp.]|nr:hypothetical protein [Proteiniphilum sp.]
SNLPLFIKIVFNYLSSNVQEKLLSYGLPLCILMHASSTYVGFIPPPYHRGTGETTAKGTAAKVCCNATRGGVITNKGKTLVSSFRV